jgi:DNA-binding CsgD family transcriptional regulator
MRNSDHDGTEAFQYITANGKAKNAYAGALVLPERLMHEPITSELSVMAALLIEAACRARDGDRDGCIDDACDLLIKCLRTGAEHGLRMVFVDGGPQIFPFLENLHHGPTSSRSLSRREAGVLQMIARGMSNKCIARSLGITPETVKTHVKAILSKLNARTRAQAVALAKTSALFASVQSAR